MIAEEKKNQQAGDIINLVKNHAAELERQRQFNSLDDVITLVKQQAQAGEAFTDSITKQPTIQLSKSQKNDLKHDFRLTRPNLETKQADMDNSVDLLKNAEPLAHFGAAKNIHTVTEKTESYINDLLAHQGEDFVKYAYVTLLKREADIGGLDYFVKKLENGKLSKVLILASLRLSKEGRIKGVDLKGLYLPLAGELLYKLPILGYCFRLLVNIFNLPGLLKSLQALEAHVYQQQKVSESQVNTLANQTQNVFLQIKDNFANAMAQTQISQKTNIDRVESLVQILAEKASHENIADLSHQIAQKADEDSVVALAKSMAEKASHESIADLSHRIAQKADEESVVAVSRNLIEKHSNEIVGQINHRIDDVNMNCETRSESLLSLFGEVKQAVEFITPEPAMDLDHLYVAFEDEFRGSKAEIRSRQEVYLPLVLDIYQKTNGAPALDVGCGRGEWIELMQDNGIDAQGLDFNKAMIKQCQLMGLNVTEADAIDYLQSLEADSLSLVTGFHIIEHISFDNLIRLYIESFRVLKKGGGVIFETPNPKNLLVGAGDFYLDPTHRQPLHPLTMKFYLATAGFESVDINYVDSSGLKNHEDTSFESLNDYVNVPRDYAIIGRKS